MIDYAEITELPGKVRDHEDVLSTIFLDVERKIKPEFMIQQSDQQLGQQTNQQIGQQTGKSTYVEEEAVNEISPEQEIKNLQLAAQYKDEFLSHLSHELRNPVSSINAAAEILSIAQPDQARLQKMTEVIKRQVNL